MQARPETLDWIRSYYKLIDTARYDECDDFFAPDAQLQIAHHPPQIGRESIGRAMRAGLSLVKSIEHELKNAWEEDDVLIFEVTAHYTLADDRKVDVTGVVIAEVADGVFVSQRIAVDLSPVYGRAAE